MMWPHAHSHSRFSPHCVKFFFMQVKTQIDDLQSYLTDASNMQGGHADKLFIPEYTLLK